MTMEKFSAAILNKRFGAILTPYAEVSVPFGWHSVVNRMLQRIHDLPSATRAMLIVDGIGTDQHGLLNVSIVANTSLMPPGGWELVEDIVADARNECAWSCILDHKPAWIVRPPKGFPRPLCPECQRTAGLKVECHSA